MSFPSVQLAGLAAFRLIWTFSVTGSLRPVRMNAGSEFWLTLFMPWHGLLTILGLSGEPSGGLFGPRLKACRSGPPISLCAEKGGAHLPQVAEDAGGFQPTLVCNVCGEHFASRNSLAGHHAKQHGSAKLARRLCSGCTCPVCLINYGDHDRLIRHLSFSGTSCLAFLAASRPQQEPAPGVRSDKSARPSVQSSGPKPLPPADLEPELFHVAAEISCFDVQALRRSVASFDPALTEALGAFDDSLNICASLPAELPINPDGLVLMRMWAHGS